jgi:GNAT superfamily N-acetyltransferase
MDQTALLTAFNEQIRQPGGGVGNVEADGKVVRFVGGEVGWAGVLWSDLDPNGSDAEAVIAAQIERFASLAGPWEWKLYSYDQPADLAERLTRAGFEPEPVEALMIAEIADLALDTAPPPGVELRDVVDEAGAAALVSVHDVVFGGDHSAIGRHVLAALDQQPLTTVGVVAWHDGAPISAGRLELLPGTDFASLWGGGTVPAWRGRGVFRSLVAHRAAIAAAHDYRYLQVDASPESRPILERLGFVQLATTTPFVYPGSGG